jgi:hypothetical protein
VDDLLSKGYVWGAGTTLLATLLTFVGMFVNQRAGHRREQEAARKATLREAYAEWAAMLDQHFERLRWLVGREKEAGSDLSDDQRKEHDAYLRRLVEEIRDAARPLMKTMHILLLLEADASLRTAVTELTEKVTGVGAGPAEWIQFQIRVDLINAGAAVPPHTAGLAELMEKLQESGALRQS